MAYKHGWRKVSVAHVNLVSEALRGGQQKADASLHLVLLQGQSTVSGDREDPDQGGVG